MSKTNTEVSAERMAPMNLTLYHNPMSTCSQKVRMALAEKAVAWTSVEIDLLSREHKNCSPSAPVAQKWGCELRSDLVSS
jgi:hypothetical protein